MALTSALNEVIWPLDRDDYLFVCDLHPTRYFSWAARVALLGEAEKVFQEAPRTKGTNGKPLELTDWHMVSTRLVGPDWRTLKQIAALQQITSRSEMGSLAKALWRGVSKGFLERRQVEVAVLFDARPRTRFCYRARKRTLAQEVV